MSVEETSRGHRRTEIVEVALRIIASRGIAALTTTLLAKELGVTTGALFRHFTSREAILDAVVQRIEALFSTDFPSADVPPRERLERFMAQRTATVAGQVGVFRLMASEQFALALPPEAAKRLRSLVEATQAFVQTAIRDGARDGVFRSDIDPATLSIVVLGTMQMMVFFHNLKLDNATPERMVKVIQTIHLLLASPKARGKSR
jgi:AcrR family transcriptional regulator